MAERLFGMETEYGFSVVAPDGAACETETAAHELLALAKRVPHLPGLRSNGLFLANGARFYVDCGTHPEFCTPECTNPWDACRYLQAGDRLLLALAGELTECERCIERTMIFKGNVDYLTRISWGCHESYLHSHADSGALSLQLIPHLVSRIVYTGMGGFDCYSPGVAFMISPRVSHLRSVVSGDSTNDRAIFNTRDEPLCNSGHQRLHVLCGESLCGETGAWLKVATTALVVALIEAGCCSGDSIAFCDALAAMRVFATDPSCARSVKLADGRTVTALDIQYHFLHKVERHADATFMPQWAGEVCKPWRATLDLLKHGAPTSVARTLDWAIKHTLFQNHLRRRNTSFEALANWTKVLSLLSAALVQTGRKKESITLELVLGARSPLAASKKKLTPFLHRLGLRWDGLEAILALRLELFEIDTRYSLLGEGGIFTRLDRNGVLDHHFPGVDNIPHATDYPPALGRAALRGEYIRRFADQNERFACEWDGVFDLRADKRFNLSDPFCVSSKWEEYFSESETVSADGLFRCGRYAEILELCEHRLSRDPSVSGVENLVLSYARLGRCAEALDALRSARLDEFHTIGLSLSVLSNGLVPAVEESEPFVASGDRCKPTLLEEADDGDSYTRFIFLQYKALWLIHKGLYQPSEKIMLALLGEDSNRWRPRMYNRLRCHFGELMRRLGRTGEALPIVDEAMREHRAGSLFGDLADHSLPMLAKLSPDTLDAGSFLEEAECMQRAHRNPLGLARILCLRARRLQTSRDRREIAALQRTVPVLAGCAVAQRIVGEWGNWVNPPAITGPADYWGL